MDSQRLSKRLTRYIDAESVAFLRLESRHASAGYSLHPI